jgi:hypothetical protein
MTENKTAEAIAAELVASMQATAAELGEGSPDALDRANEFFRTEFPNADAATAECEAFADDCQAMLERWTERYR